MTKLVKLSLAAAVMVTGLVAAEKKEEVLKVSGDMTLTTDSIWRGVSGTNSTPTIQGTLNVQHKSGVYAGVWGTGSDYGTEIDLFVGYTTEVKGFGIDVGFVDMTESHPATEEWIVDASGELYLGVSKSIAKIDLGATIYQEVLNDEDSTTTFEGTVGKDFSVVYANVVGGYQVHTQDNVDDTKYYSATVGKSFESIKGDLSFTFANHTSEIDDAVYALSYTTSF